MKETAGPCIWCGRYVEDRKKESGFTGDHADWATEDGDFGCDLSPETCHDGAGGHARPSDAWRWGIAAGTILPPPTE
jgi:hypothetical protein